MKYSNETWLDGAYMGCVVKRSIFRIVNKRGMCVDDYDELLYGDDAEQFARDKLPYWTRLDEYGIYTPYRVERGEVESFEYGIKPKKI